MKEKSLSTLNTRLTILIFLISIYFPFFIAIVEDDKLVSGIEKRSLSEYPKAPKNIEEVKNYPKLLNIYYSDHFGLRNWFLGGYRWVKYNLGDSPSKDVTIGKDGWLFLGSVREENDKYNDPMGDIMNLNLYSEEQLDDFSRKMNNLDLWLNGKGIKYIFVIAPNKHTIYFDKLPNYISKANKHSATDQLVKHLKMNTNICVVDLRRALIRQKDKYQLYYKEDTHWNSYGANIAQYEILQEVEALFPKQITPEMMSFTTGVKTGGDLTSLMGVRGSDEPNPHPIFKQSRQPIKWQAKEGLMETYTMTSKDQTLNAIIFGDSFSVFLEPYLSRKFKRSTYVWSKINYPTLIEYAKLECPDIVIEEWVERSLPCSPKEDDEFKYSFQRDLFMSCGEESIFFNNWKELKINPHLTIIDDKNGVFRLNSTGNDPMIMFPPLLFEENTLYILHLKVISSSESILQLFYSDKNNTACPFSERNSVRTEIKQGSNDIYISLDHSNLGKHLRLDPIYGNGSITIENLEIKKISQRPTPRHPNGVRK